jgi:hypothetical protein
MEHGKMLKLPCYMAKTTLNELHSAFLPEHTVSIVADSHPHLRCGSGEGVNRH